MALDTALKRASAIDLDMPWRTMLPVPDGSIDQADRQAVAWLYSGILASGAVAPVPVPAAGGVFPARIVRRIKRDKFGRRILLPPARRKRASAGASSRKTAVVEAAIAVEAAPVSKADSAAIADHAMQRMATQEAEQVEEIMMIMLLLTELDDG